MAHQIVQGFVCTAIFWGLVLLGQVIWHLVAEARENKAQYLKNEATRPKIFSDAVLLELHKQMLASKNSQK